MPKEEAPRIRARSKSAFAESHSEQVSKESFESVEQISETEESIEPTEQPWHQEEPTRMKTSAELRQEIFGEEEPSSSATIHTNQIEEATKGRS